MTDTMTSNVRIGAIADFPDGEIRPASLPDGTTLAVYNVDGTIYATADLCTHGEASLSEEGILTGISGGTTFAVARQIASNAPAGSVILCMLPDTGERYLSTPLFANIPVDMNEEELKISRSTPTAQLNA